MKPRATHKEKTLRAFRVYVELMETAAWMRGWMRGPLELFDLTQQGFRLLLLLYEEGPMRMTDAARRMKFKRQTLDPVVQRLEKRGWVKRHKVTLPQMERPRSKTRLLGPQRRRWGIGVIALTREGERFIADVFPQHSKVLKALMRALLGREQKALVEICRKLRQGAVVKFMSEIALLEPWESDVGGEVEVEDGDAEKARSRLLVGKSSDESRVMSGEKDGGIAKVGVGGEKDRELLESIVEKMKKYDILKAATQVDWNKPRDEDREAGHAVRMLMNVANDRERKVLERMAAKMSNGEVVRVFREIDGE